MPHDLGARLVRAGLVTRTQLAEALARGPKTGGPLVAALIDAGLDEEALIGFFLADGYSEVLDLTELLAAEPEALRRVPAAMARALLVVPVRFERGGLRVAMADPTDEHALREMRHALGLLPVPGVARVGDVRAAIVRFHGAEAEPEEPAVELVRRRARESAATFPLVRTKPLVTPPTPIAQAVAEVAETGVRSATHREQPVELPNPNDAIPLAGRRRRRNTSSFETPSDEATIPVDVEVGPPAIEVGAPAPVATGPADTWNDLGPPRATQPAPSHVPRPSSAPGPRTSLRLRARPASDAAPGTPPDVGTFVAAIRASEERDEVLALACEACLTVARGAVLLGLQRGALRGREGAGRGISREAIRNLVLPATAPSVFKQVLETGIPHHGAYGTASADEVFRVATGSLGRSLQVQPILVGGRPAGLLCADEVGFGPAGRARIELIAFAAGEALQRIVLAQRGR